MYDISYQLYENKGKLNIKENILEFTINTQMSINEYNGDYVCCNNNQKGCCLKIDNYKFYICHRHLFAMLDFFHNLLNKMNNYQIALVKFFNINLLVNKSKVIYIRKTIRDYLYNVYKRQDDDAFYSDDLSNNQKTVVKSFEDKLQKEHNEEEYIKTLSTGQYHHFQIKKELINRVQDCVHYDKILYYPKEQAILTPVKSIMAYSSIRDIKCKSSIHEHNTSAVLSLMNQRDDCFAFSYCEDCLYDYYLVLFLAYTNYNDEEFVVGNFKILHKASQETCFFTGINEPRMYQIFHNNVSFFVCQSSFELILKTIINSAAFQELFPNEARRSSTVLNKAEEQWYIKYYNKKINELSDKIYVLSEKNLDLQDDNITLKNKLNCIDGLINERKQKEAVQINDKILNCLLLNNSMHLSVKKKTAKKSANKEYKVTFISGIECRTLDHPAKNDFIALLEFNRENDVCCLALCRTCINHILHGIEFAMQNRQDYINDFVKLKIITTNSDAHHCYKCGNITKRMHNISLSNVELTLCTNCLLKLEKTLKDIKENFTLISQIGGIEFLRNRVIDLNIR